MGDSFLFLSYCCNPFIDQRKHSFSVPIIMCKNIIRYPRRFRIIMLIKTKSLALYTNLPRNKMPENIALDTLKRVYFFGSHSHSLAGFLQPEQTLSLIGLPHVLHGEHPQDWHIVASPFLFCTSRIFAALPPCKIASQRFTLHVHWLQSCLSVCRPAKMHSPSFPDGFNCNDIV